MVKSVLGVHHQGLRDWIFQRLSALYMAFYFCLLLGFFLTHPAFTYEDWHTFFSNLFVKVSTLILLASLLMHAWVGMWTIFTDYVPVFLIRAILNIIVLFSLIACFFWGLMIVGSV